MPTVKVEFPTERGCKAFMSANSLEEGGKTGALTRESMSGRVPVPLYPVVQTKIPKTDEKWLADLKSEGESL